MLAGTSATVRHPARPKSWLSVSRELVSSASYRCWLSTHRPDWRVACASQLIAPNVGEVRKALRLEKPASFSRSVPEARTALTPAEKEESSIATRPKLSTNTNRTSLPRSPVSSSCAGTSRSGSFSAASANSRWSRSSDGIRLTWP